MKLFYNIILPVTWATVAIISYSHPGDEYGIFVVSTIAGSWVCVCMQNIGHLRDVLWIILITGIAILAILGFVMDRLRISKLTWMGVFFLCFVAVLILSLCQYSSLDRAISKNGSLTAYIAGACNIGLYMSIMLAFLIKGITVTVQKLNQKRCRTKASPANR